MNDDDRLLDALSAALAPPPAEPSDEEIAALRYAVVRCFAPPRVRPWWQPRGFGGRAPIADRAVTLLAAAALCTATAVAVAGSPVPAPVRTLARAVGLPVDSAALADTRAAVGRLRAKLEAQDREGTARALEDLRSRIDALSERDRRALGEETAALFLKAEAFAAPPAPKAAPPVPRQSTARHAAASRAEGDEVDLEDRDHPPPSICVLLEDEAEDEPKAREELPGEAQPDIDEDDEEAARAPEKTEHDARAREKTEHSPASPARERACRATGS
jgi:hypothetical protein